MKLSDVRIFLAIVVMAIFALPVATAGADAPATVEYGYEPIPGIEGSDALKNPGLGEASGNGVRGASEGQADGGSSVLGIVDQSWLLIAALVALTALIGFLAWSKLRGRHLGMAAIRRMVVLAAVIVALPLITLGTTANAKRAPAPKGFFGLITQTDFTKTDAVKMAQGGVESLRIPIAWGTVQPNGPDSFDWTSVDNTIRTLSDVGISALPFLYDSPSWSSKRNTDLPVQTATQRQNWSNFVSTAVARYGPDGVFWEENGTDSEDPVAKAPIRTWQVWNEANFFYFATPVSPSRYVQLLKLTNKAIKSVDPRAKIMMSGLYGSPPKRQVNQGKAMTAAKFLEGAYRAGAKPFFDVAALHPYTPNTQQTRALLDRFRATMAKFADRKTPMSVTEVGWGSGRGGFLDMGSPQKQAAQVKSAYNLFIGSRAKYRLNSVYWFTWKDKPRSESSCNFCYTTGFFKAGAGYKAKPAWTQFVRLAGGRR